MIKMFKPEGYPTVSPYLVVADAGKTIDFVKAILDGEELRRFPDENGKVMHSEIRIDDSVLMIADCAEGWPAVPSYVHIYVSNVDDVHRRAVEFGATSVQIPIQKGDEDKRGGVQDSGGTTWWIATRMTP